MNSGGLNSGMNSDLAKQMSLLSAAGRLRATSAAGQQQQQQQQQRMGMAPPVPPNAPDKQRGQFLAMLVQVLAQRGVVLPPFVTGQPNPAWNPESGPLKHIQPATENRPGALRMPGAVPGRAGDLDLFKLWGAVTSGGGMQRVRSSLLASVAVLSLLTAMYRSPLVDNGKMSQTTSDYNFHPLSLVPLICQLPSSPNSILCYCLRSRNT